MSTIDNPSLRQRLQQYIQQRDDTFTWVEMHGLLCAIATGPAIDSEWQQLALLEDEAPAISADICDLMSQLAARLASDIAAEDGLTLPCLLDPYKEDDGNDLVSWCSGFMTAVLCFENEWYQVNEEQIVQLLLPILLISGLDDDEAFDELWENSELTRKMALSIPDLLEEIFLHFHAPELAKS